MVVIEGGGADAKIYVEITSFIGAAGRDKGSKTAGYSGRLILGYFVSQIERRGGELFEGSPVAFHLCFERLEES
jgi:hypothetical protein